MRGLFLLTFALGLYFPTAHAERRLHIHSQYDTFDLRLTGRTGYVEGRRADLTAFQTLLPLLTDKPNQDCPPLPTKPDVTVTENGKIRKIYVAQGTVSDGTQCLGVTGNGLYYFPIHRDFLVGPRVGSLKLDSPIKVFRDGAKVLELVKQSGHWTVGTDASLLPNWDFLRQFESSLHHFKMQTRVQVGLSKGKPKMIIMMGDQSYTFYLLKDSLWAIQLPKTHWLTVSSSWAFWGDFDKDVLEDHLVDQIQTVENDQLNKTSRLQAMANLDTSWSQNIRELCHKLLLDPKAPVELQKAALRRLRSKPAKDSAKAIGQFVGQTSNPDLKKTAQTILKLWKRVGIRN